MKKIETRTLVEASILSAVSAVIMIASVYVPFFILAGVIIWPIPITYLTLKYDIKVSVMSLIVSLFIVGGIVTPLSAISMGLLYGVPAVVLGFCLRKKYNPFTSVVAMAISMFVAYIAVIKLGAFLTGVDAFEDFLKLLDQSASMAKDILKSAGMDETQINQFVDQAFNKEIIRMFMPGMLAITSLVGSYINYFVVQAIFKRLRIKINEISVIKPIDEWYINNNLSFGVFFATIAALILNLFKVPNAEIVYSSIFLIFRFMFEIDGLAVLFWLLKKWGIGKTLRIVIIVFVMFTGLSRFLFFIGLIDYVVDFRKINPARNRRTPPEE